MKIKNLLLKNFAKVSEISVSFDKNITYLIGNNGSGKTTIGLNGVWFVIKGLAQKGDGLIAERFRFIGPHSKSAKAEMIIYDEAEKLEIKISRKLLKNKTELKIEASDGRQLDQAWLDSIFNSFLIDPMGFSRLSGKDQALAFGADTSVFDAKKKEIYQERLLIGRDVERLQGVVDTAIKSGVEKVEAVDIGELMVDLDKRREINELNRLEIRTLKKAEFDLESHKDELGSYETQLLKLQTAVAEKKAIIEDLEGAKNKLKLDCSNMKEADEQAIKDKIESAQEVNQKATAYERFRDDESELSDLKDDYEDGTNNIQSVEADRTEYLKSLKLPWPNITINDEGEFRLNDKPFCSQYFSTGEMLMFGSRIASKLNPDAMKYVYFPCSNIMDDKNRESTFKTMVKEGFQVVVEYVSTEKIPEQSCILLKEMRVVESYDETAGDGRK